MATILGGSELSDQIIVDVGMGSISKYSKILSYRYSGVLIGVKVNLLNRDPTECRTATKDPQDPQDPRAQSPETNHHLIQRFANSGFALVQLAHMMYRCLGRSI